MYQSRNVISDEPAAWCTLRTLWVEQRCMCPDLVCAQHTKLLTPMAEPLAAVLFVIFIGIVGIVGCWPPDTGVENKPVEVVPLDDVLTSSWSSFRQHVGDFPENKPSISFSVGEWECDCNPYPRRRRQERSTGWASKSHRTGQSSWAFHLSHVFQRCKAPPILHSCDVA